jgi:hypothetical protein
LVVSVVGHAIPVRRPEALSEVSERRSGIVPRMPTLLSIRVAEPWTALSQVVFVALVIILAGMALWLIHRS